MKTAALFLAAAAATLAAAEPQKAMPSGTKINCARPNGSYCMSDDTILKCDGNADGMPMKCADDIMAMSPSAKGGAATCRESSKEAGDAACMKNASLIFLSFFYLAASKLTIYDPSASSMPAPPSTLSALTSALPALRPALLLRALLPLALPPRPTAVLLPASPLALLP